MRWPVGGNEKPESCFKCADLALEDGQFACKNPLTAEFAGRLHRGIRDPFVAPAWCPRDDDASALLRNLQVVEDEEREKERIRRWKRE